MKEIDEERIIKYINGNLSAHEKAAVDEWLAVSPENGKLLEQLYFMLELTERLKVMRSVDADKAFLQFRKKKEINKQKEKFSGFVLGQTFRRLAAVLILPLLLLAGYMLLRAPEGETQWVERITQRGEVLVFNLPDGSRVWLNGGSSLRYADAFGRDDRRVELTGESYFEVTPDAGRPFIVSVGETYQVRVLGTSFNVSAYAADQAIETTLVEGLVDIELLSANGNPTVCRLAPGERAEYQKQKKTLDVKKVNTATDTGWIDGEMVFDLDPMEKVLKTLERHYNVQFDVKSPDIMEASIKARFKNEELSQVLEYLKVASGIEFKYKPLDSGSQEREIPIIEIYR
ncbi:FecR family protein [Parabacteroides sp. PF5-6]|uniref:FecR family protein n=1 Tax=Parabacteroides sp. PF5-6 TaxID=1742403 RepID=UPI002406EA1F|nr:FecR family protein [Parabacteroides sp. PF5-6]MDF9830839.1 ferric-dicitrate binding protein FerR (iron transport regulator) [Parabacteroides sp. PF5-6]